MEKLINCKSGACEIGAPLVTVEERAEFLPQIPEWKIVAVDNVERLIRKYTFDDFAKAIEFTNKVGQLAEDDGHHPAILTEWGRVEVSWWSHKIKGLHKNDFILAAKTDMIYNS